MSDFTVTINPPETTSIAIGGGIFPHNSTHAPNGSDSLESWYATTGSLAYVSGQISIPAGTVLLTGDQNVSGVKNFSSRPTVNGSGVMLTGENGGTGYLAGYVQKTETGAFVSSNQTGQLTGAFYPLSSNPSAYLQGAVVRPSNTGNFVDTVSSQTINNLKTFNSGIIVGQNSVNGTGSSALGGSGNHITGRNSVVVAGINNRVNAANSFIGGGHNNRVETSGSAVVGGWANVVESTAGVNNFIGGGVGNRVDNGSYNAIHGGTNNSILEGQDKNAILGGEANTLSNTSNCFALGSYNTLFGASSTIENSFALGYNASVTHSNAAVLNQGVGITESSGEKTIVVQFDSGIYLKGPTFFSSRPTLNGTGFLLSGEASTPSTGYLTGFVNKNETGNFVTASQTGQFYAASNPQGFITNSSLAPYATIGYVTGISGYQSGLISSLQTATGVLDTRLITVEGVTGSFALAVNTGAFLTTGAGDVRYVNASGDTVNGNLEITGYTSGQTFVVKNGGYIDFQTGTPPWKEGRVFYDDDSKTLSYFNNEPDVTVNIGQESIIHVSNGETGNILNGRVVYISGSQGNRPKGYLASAASGSPAWDRTIGIATHDISTQGYVTTFGVVNGLNTTGFIEGDHLYLSETVPGTFSTTIPNSPNHKVQVGTVLRSHATQGSIFVTINQGNHLWNLHDVKRDVWTNDQILRYNESSGYWEARNLNTGIFTQTGFVTGISGSLQSQITSLNNQTGLYVLLTGSQTISGNKEFNSRPTVGGTGVILQGEVTESSIPLLSAIWS